MGDLLSYKAKFFNNRISYYGTVEYSAKENCLQGRIVGIRKTISYRAVSLEELQSQFERSINQYLQECQRDQKIPEMPYKGSFQVRLPSELHRDIGIYAIEHGENLNSVIIEAISEFLENRKNES